MTMEDTASLIVGGIALALGLLGMAWHVHYLNSEVRRLKARLVRAETNVELMKFDLNRFRGIR